MLRLQRFEGLLWTVGLLCAGYCVMLAALTFVSRREADAIVVASAKVPPSATAGGTAQQGSGTPDEHDEGAVIGRIDIPALKLSAPITADYDPESLRHGVGHIRGTAMPGGLGTTGLAGHRDSFFRPLRHATAKMEIRLSDKTGTYRYTIDATEIVSPTQVELLDVTSRPGLTLITCFPFDYVGPAPKRFIVHAHLLSVSPERTATP